jgi:hypothetical protein
MSMDNKVLPSRKVSTRLGPIGAYPSQNTTSIPSQRGMAAPAEPPGHRNWGADGKGSGTGAYMPLKK